MPVDAVYQHQPARVCETVAEAARRWVAHFLDYAAAKSGMSAALDAVVASGADPFADSHTLLTGAVGRLLEAGARDGTLRTDLTPDVVLLLMGGIAYSVRHGTPSQAGQLVDLLMDALATGAAARPVGE
ncbi:MAG: hypothetical protein QOI78_5446 [Actinomycetota bacterium]|nr:hypothetical protein [Actinomycetota bacterium]